MMNESSLKYKAYKYIRDKIISCEYEPGDFIDESTLIKEINVSRTPIREALNKIEQENLIQILPKKGVVVCHITFKNVVDIYQMREIIEPLAILEHSDNIDRKKINFYKESLIKYSNNMAKVYNLDDRFHRHIISSYGNSYISTVMDKILLQNQRIRTLTDKRKNYMSDSSEEHIKIMDLILEDDILKAGESMKNHILLSKKRTLELIQKW